MHTTSPSKYPTHNDSIVQRATRVILRSAFINVDARVEAVASIEFLTLASVCPR